MTRPTPRQLQALQALRGNDDVVEYLQGCLEDRKAKLVGLADEESFRVCQGQAQSYKALLDTILGASNTHSGKR